MILRQNQVTVTVSDSVPCRFSPGAHNEYSQTAHDGVPDLPQQRLVDNGDLPVLRMSIAEIVKQTPTMSEKDRLPLHETPPNPTSRAALQPGVRKGIPDVATLSTGFRTSAKVLMQGNPKNGHKSLPRPPKRAFWERDEVHEQVFEPPECFPDLLVVGGLGGWVLRCCATTTGMRHEFEFSDTTRCRRSGGSRSSHILPRNRRLFRVFSPCNRSSFRARNSNS